MDIAYLIKPKNKNLHTFSLSFYNFFLEFNLEDVKLINKNHIWSIPLKLLKIDFKKEVSIFFFSTQPEYVMLILLVRLVSYISKIKIVVYHQMHEPYYEKGRAGLRTSFLLYILNLLISHLSDRIILPSEQAVSKAKRFVRSEKIVQLNLTFPTSMQRRKFSENIRILKSSWNENKKYALIGGTAPDRNPEGFLRLADLSHKNYPGAAKFIRAGVDKDVNIDYRKPGVIQFSGYILDEAKEFLLSLTHIVVIPYEFSTQSAVIPESLMHGKLLIVNDIPAFDYLKSSEFTFVVDFNSSSELSDCLEKIQEISVEEYEKLCCLAIDYFYQNHSERYLVKQMKKILL